MTHTGSPALALSDAVADRDEAAVERLLAEGGDPNGPAHRVPDGFLPIYHIGEHVPLLVSAAMSGHSGVVRRLLDAGARVDAAVTARRYYQTHDDSYTVDDGTPLCFAAEEGHTEVVALLLDRGAAIDASDDSHNTALALAASRGRLATVELLVSRGADLGATNGDYLTALDRACWEGHAAAAGALQAAGARRGRRAIPWPWALRSAALRGDPTDLEFVLRRGGTRLTRSALNDALLAAAYLGHAAIVQRLLDRGADPDAADQDETALLMALGQGHVDAARALLAGGAALPRGEALERARQRARAADLLAVLALLEEAAGGPGRPPGGVESS